MAHLFFNTESDSLYLDVTTGDRFPATMAEVADGVFLHVDEAGNVAALEVLDVSRRGGRGDADEPEMGRVHLNPISDSLYLDVSAGARAPLRMVAIADGVHVHVDGVGELVAIELMDFSRRGGLRVDDLDAAPGVARPGIFDEIERAASGQGDPAAPP